MIVIYKQYVPMFIYTIYFTIFLKNLDDYDEM